MKFIFGMSVMQNERNTCVFSWALVHFILMKIKGDIYD